MECGRKGVEALNFLQLKIILDVMKRKRKLKMDLENPRFTQMAMH